MPIHCNTCGCLADSDDRCMLCGAVPWNTPCTDGDNPSVADDIDVGELEVVD